MRIGHLNLRVASRRPFVLVWLGLAVLLGSIAPSTSRAQTVGGATISATEQPAPNRIVNGVNLGYSERSMLFNPLGINYDDCIRDMTLQFNVTLSGFAGQDNMQVWATNQGSCNASTDLGIQAVPICWLVNAGITVPNAEQPFTYTFNIRVQDLVAPLNGVLPPAGSIPNGDATACSHQESFASVPVTIWFLALSTAGGVDGNATDYSYQISVDMVGPPAPAGVSIGDGDTLFIVNWVANTDADTGGYDVFIDPVPGQVASDASTTPSNAQLVCPDASSDDGSTSGCVLLSTGGTTTTGSAAACNSTVLTGSILQPNATVEATTEFDDAGNVIDSGEVEQGTGGIATIPCANLVGTSCTAGQPVYSAQNVSVTGESDAHFNLSGLTNGNMYTVAVSAVDLFGNPGPPSTEACATPEPVDDFWKLYREAGGQAGGGFCALEVVGSRAGSSAALFAVGLVGLAATRRRRRRRAS
jgi:hypothetical protein